MPSQRADNIDLETEAKPQLSTVPHTRTLHNARKQVKFMVANDDYAPSPEVAAIVSLSA